MDEKDGKYIGTAIEWYSFDLMQAIRERYSVTKGGRVFSKATNRPVKKVIKGGRNRVSLKLGNSTFTYYVDELIMANYSSAEPLKNINHKDGDFLNDAYTNLEYEDDPVEVGLPEFKFDSDEITKPVNYDGLRAETLRQWYLIEKKMDEEFEAQKAEAMELFVESLSESRIPIEAEDSDVRLMYRLRKRTPGVAKRRIYKNIYELASEENLTLGAALQGVQHSAEFDEIFLGGYWEYLG